MRILILFAVAAASCGGGKTCSDAFGQDCGTMVNVTLRYTTTQELAAGPVFGGADAGVGCALSDGGTGCRCSACEVAQAMPLAQFEYAVRPKIGCAETWTSASDVVINCTSSCGNNRIPPGAENTACVWAPPLLPPQ